MDHSLIRWIAYPSILILASSLAQKCSDPNAFIFKGCETDPSVSVPLILISIFILEHILYDKNKKEAEKRRKEIEGRQRQIEEEAEKLRLEDQLRHDKLRSDDKEERLKIYRIDIVKKLGTVSNYLTHLVDPAYTDKQNFIKQQMANELNEIVAKHLLNDLRELIQRNEEIQHKLRYLRDKYIQHAIENDDLELMLKLLPSN